MQTLPKSVNREIQTISLFKKESQLLNKRESINKKVNRALFFYLTIALTITLLLIKYMPKEYIGY